MSLRAPQSLRTIKGDKLEQSRIRLERDIENNIPSPPSMSSSDAPNCDHDDISSVDFARHGSHHMHSFHSFEHPSYLDSDFHSRHGDGDSIGLDPDLGHTMSTAAHHASALTLSAGLHGRNYTPGRSRQSGAEFDPERPLQPIMLNTKIRDNLSVFDTTMRSKSKSRKDPSTFDPVVVDSTADLDRLLQTGHWKPNTSDVSDAETSPRLSKVLGNQFSPKRPRSVPNVSNMSQARRPENPTPSRVAFDVSNKPHRPKGQPAPSSLNPARQESKHMSQDKMSLDAQHGINVESRVRPRNAIKDKENGLTPRAPKGGIFASTPANAQGKRPPFSNIGNGGHVQMKKKSDDRVHLPDVTGLTSAVESPMKGVEGYLQPNVGNPSLAMDLIDALDNLQSRLQALERENSVSHRRVQELEYDLEECKADIVRERARMKDRERQIDDDNKLWREHVKARQARERLHEEEIANYREIVEEKKSLESLIATMQAHLSRLTLELDLHKALVTGLRADVRGTENIQADVVVLRAKVERLGGEVERLKAFVEEGLRQRKRSKDMSATTRESKNEHEQSNMPSQVGIDLTYVTNPLGGEEATKERNETLTLEQLQPQSQDQESDNEDEGAYNYSAEEAKEEEQNQDQEEEPFREEETVPEPKAMPERSRSLRFIDDHELARVEAEMRERRSERSLSKSGSSVSSRANDSGNGSSMRDGGRNSPVPEFESFIQNASSIQNASQAAQHASHGEPTDNFTQGQYVSHSSKANPPKDDVPRTPFPHIRGSRMEQLFFSAPEHNARTCHVCHRRQRRDDKIRITPQANFEKEEKERAEADLVKSYLCYKERRRNNGKKSTGGRDSEAEPDVDRLPPQTILARVIQELEDDFSHYKAIYIELAEQYGVIDATSNVAKRNVLADHLREVIDTLEQKGDHIASLYELLNFQDKPNSRPSRAAPPPPLSRAKYSHVA